MARHTADFCFLWLSRIFQGTIGQLHSHPTQGDQNVQGIQRVRNEGECARHGGRIIIGAAFGKIITSFVSDILMPPLGLLLGKVDFSSLFIDLTGQAHPTIAAAKAAGAATINYGIFINTIIDFVLVAFAVFLLVKQINRFKRQPAAAASTTKDCPFCASPIPIPASRCPHCTSQLTGSATQR